MTRFARYRRSKSSGSFAKVPEEATSWAELKMQMDMRRDSDEAEESPQEAKTGGNAKRCSVDGDSDNSEKSLVKKKDSVNISSSWSEFETSIDGKTKKKPGKSPLKDNTRENNVENLGMNKKVSPMVKNKRKRKRINNQVNARAEAMECEQVMTGNDVDEERTSEETPSKLIMKNRKRKLTEGDDENNDQEEEVEHNTSVKSQFNIKKLNNKRKKNNKKKMNDSQQDARKSERTEKQDTPGKRKTKAEQEKDLTVVVDGVKEKVTKFGGFYILQTDADRIEKVKEKLIKEGRPRAEIDGVLRRHRRNAEKALSRKKKKLCFHCREGVHVLSDCPKLVENNKSNNNTMATGVCYKCGSTEHNLYQCKEPGTELKFANCFICKENGHLSKQCPDNPRGLYPQGGACRICGDVTHLKRDCPELIKKKRDNTITVGTIGKSIESLDEDRILSKKSFSSRKIQKKVKKVVKF